MKHVTLARKNNGSLRGVFCLSGPANFAQIPQPIILRAFSTSIDRQATYSRGEHALARRAKPTSTHRDKPGGGADDKSHCGVDLL